MNRPENDEADVDAMLERLETGLLDTSDVYVNQGVDPLAYFTALSDDIRRHKCAPFEVSAVVMPPGFPDIPVGTAITGWCVARREGYWLAYRPEDDCFYCFWGTGRDHLGAHGVFGSPMYCWSA